MNMLANEVRYLDVVHRAGENNESEQVEAKCHVLVDGIGEARLKITEPTASRVEHGFSNCGKRIIGLWGPGCPVCLGLSRSCLSLGINVAFELVGVGHHLWDCVDSGDHDNLGAVDGEGELQRSFTSDIGCSHGPIIEDLDLEWFSAAACQRGHLKETGGTHR